MLARGLYYMGDVGGDQTDTDLNSAPIPLILGQRTERLMPLIPMTDTAPPLPDWSRCETSDPGHDTDGGYADSHLPIHPSVQRPPD
jgi:hypothetical protein